MLEDDGLEHMLENWGRWCHERKQAKTCESIERLWRSPQEWYAPGAPIVPGPPVDHRLAIEINSAWRVIPHPYKPVLSDWYVLHTSPSRTCRRLNLARVAHAECLHRARIMCWNIWKRQNRHIWVRLDTRPQPIVQTANAE